MNTKRTFITIKVHLSLRSGVASGSDADFHLYKTILLSHYLHLHLTDFPKTDLLVKMNSAGRINGDRPRFYPPTENNLLPLGSAFRISLVCGPPPFFSWPTRLLKKNDRRPVEAFAGKNRGLSQFSRHAPVKSYSFSENPRHDVMDHVISRS